MRDKEKSFHMLAYNSTLAAVTGYQQVNAIVDSVFGISDNSYEMYDDLDVIGAYAGHLAALRAQLTTPSLALRGNPHIVPVSGVLLPPNDPNFMEMTASPIRVRRDENLRANLEGNGATDALVVALIIDPRAHSFNVSEMARKSMRWVRGTATVTTAVRAWAVGSNITFDDPLEGGKYGVYGMQAFFSSSLACRLIFPGQVFRPGCLSQAAAASRSAPFFQGGGGLWGEFTTYNQPRIEALDTGAGPVTYTVWLLIAKHDEKEGASDRG